MKDSLIDCSTKEKILKFRDNRDWLKYHNGKDLAISISLEAGELLEIFQWSGTDLDKVNRIDRIKDELADIVIYCQMMADYYHLNIDTIIEEKLKKNLAKYPDGKKINLTTKDDYISEADKLANYCMATLDLTAKHYAEPYGSLGPCLIDCVYSLQTKYFPVVIPLINRYGNKYMNGDAHADGYTLSDFVKHIENAGGPRNFAENVLKNRQVLSGRLKSEVCLELANKLIANGVETKEDFNSQSKVEMEGLLRSIKGIGDAASNYFFMLTGDSSRIKPDVHIHHCIRDAIGYDVSNEMCQELFENAVKVLKEKYPNITVAALDGLVWNKYRVGKR